MTGLNAPDPAKAQSFGGEYSNEAKELLQKEGPKYQYGKGCLSDGVLGAWIARMCGLEDPIDPKNKEGEENLSDHANPQRPAYALGDEGSGAHLGKKVIQYYLYNTFDEELRYKFDEKYKTDRAGILENVYKKPLPNRYLASYTHFLAENRNHFMVENIIEDGLNDFFFTHLCKYNESWKMPIHFTGGVAWTFRDVVADLCQSYQFEPGLILKTPMEGLVKYHVK